MQATHANNALYKKRRATNAIGLALFALPVIVLMVVLAPLGRR